MSESSIMRGQRTCGPFLLKTIFQLQFSLLETRVRSSAEFSVFPQKHTHARALITLHSGTLTCKFHVFQEQAPLSVYSSFTSTIKIFIKMNASDMYSFQTPPLSKNSTELRINMTKHIKKNVKN